MIEFFIPLSRPCTVGVMLFPHCECSTFKSFIPLCVSLPCTVTLSAAGVTVRVQEEQEVAESEAERNVLILVKSGVSEVPVTVLVMSSEEFSFEDPDQALRECVTLCVRE